MRMTHTSTLSDESRTASAVGPNAGMNCDRIARFYRAAEYLAFGRTLQACRVMFLGDVADRRRALVCGGGDGRFLGALLRTNQEIRVDFVDLSAGMVSIARRRVDAIGSEASAQTRFYVGDILRFNPAKGELYDLVTAHFFLDCFDHVEVERVACKLGSFVPSGASLLLSDFRIPPRGIAGYIDTAIVRSLYAAFRLTTGLRVTRLPDYEGALERAGFCKQREVTKLGGLLAASLWRKA